MSSTEATAAPTPIPALAPALNDPLLDGSSLLEGVGAELEEVGSVGVGEADVESVVPIEVESVVCRSGSRPSQPKHLRKFLHVLSRIGAGNIHTGVGVA
jgi:hypothetical protein